ncbi:ABC-2 family transporter protein [Lactobacillus helsingborgensis]|uniref:ABC transporter permease n=1 Tax=Lactobacillus helsingborgensis TaxID=1218494 RepID=UPI0027408C74|nr:ABC-2 family transporter protein [Lactobacillus helsingborgensis]WLT00510.1 ABC-2 family transporter protein [Lactobacillus helsingborgensis]
MRYRLMLIKIGIKKGLASKYALIFWLFSSLISLTVQYFLWQAVLTGKPTSEFQQTISYLVLMQLLTVLFPKTSYDVNDKVRSGDIALDLLKPVAFATQLLWESIGYSVVKFAVIGTVDLLVCLWILNFQIAVSTILMVLVTTTLAYLLYFELELLLGTFSFYTYSIWGISTFKEAILLVLAGNIFPTNFYPAVIKKLAAYLPFQYSFGAIGMLAQKPSWALFVQVVLIQLFYIILFNVLFNFLFKRSVVSTVIQGG